MNKTKIERQQKTEIFYKYSVSQLSHVHEFILSKTSQQYRETESV